MNRTQQDPARTVLLKLYPDQSNLQLEDIKISVAFARSTNGFLSFLNIRTPWKNGFMLVTGKCG